MSASASRRARGSSSKSEACSACASARASSPAERRSAAAPSASPSAKSVAVRASASQAPLPTLWRGVSAAAAKNADACARRGGVSVSLGGSGRTACQLRETAPVPRHRTRSARCTLQQRLTRCASVPTRPLCRPVSASASRGSVYAPPRSSPRGPPRAPVKRGLARLRTARRPSPCPAPSPLARTHAARPARREQDQPRTGGRGLRARAERLPARASRTLPRAKRHRRHIRAGGGTRRVRLVRGEGRGVFT